MTQLTHYLDGRFSEVDKHFEQVNQRFLRIQRYMDNRFTGLEEKLDEKASQKSVDTLTDTVELLTP